MEAAMSILCSSMEGPARSKARLAREVTQVLSVMFESTERHEAMRRSHVHQGCGLKTYA